jgi:hypothetical protein
MTQGFHRLFPELAIAWRDHREWRMDMKSWTIFRDAHTGGRMKSEYDVISIRAPIDRATEVFRARFGRHPEASACICCGPDYWVYENKEAPASARERERAMAIIPEA